MLLRADGSFLLTQRPAGKVYGGHWEFPGGKLEPGEDARAALVREIREELALEIEVGQRLGRGVSEQDGRRIELEVFAATRVGGEVRLAEHCRYGWFAAHEIDGLDWAAADRPVLAALKRRLRAGG